MQNRGGFSLLLARKIVDLTRALGVLRPLTLRRRKYFIFAGLLMTVTFVVTFDVAAIIAETLGFSVKCNYIDPCSDVSFVNFLSNGTSLCPFCPLKRVHMLLDYARTPLEKALPWVELGGRYEPHHCVSRQHVAIIVPYRDRQNHLEVFLKNIHPFLRSQLVRYSIYVVEQSSRLKFNRGTLLNIGYSEASKQRSFDCFIFHDVDYIPLDMRNMYTCSSVPKHMSVIVDNFRDRLPYVDFFGGVTAMTSAQLQLINGYPNRYWGWGGEDDDVIERIKAANFSIVRPFADVGRYKMLGHTRDKGNPINPKRYEMLYQARELSHFDGLNDMRYTLKAKEERKLYTWVYVDLHSPPPPPASLPSFGFHRIFY